MSKISLQINQERLFQNLKLSFSNRFSVLSELAQNARRAKAKFVDFILDGDTLTVTDDGEGVKDFQHLLTVAESGWNPETCEKEGPFGMGFLSALFAGQEVEVFSRGHKVCLICDDLIANALAKVEKNPEGDDGLTRIVIRGMDILGIEEHLNEMAKGFPIDVRFGGKPLERPHAIDTANETQRFVATEIGTISLNGIHRKTPGIMAEHTYFYLQGLPISRYPFRNYHNSNANIIHLDSTKFTARIPDRDTLVNAKEQLSIIDKFIEDYWRTHLKERITNLSPENFCQIYGSATLVYDRSLFCQLPILPNLFLEEIIDYPRDTYDGDFFIMGRKLHLSRREIENEDVFLVYEPESIYHGEPADLWMYLEKRKAILVSSLPDNHWAIPYVHRLDERQVTVKPVKPGKKDNYNGTWVWGAVQLCEAVSIEVEGLNEKALITDDGFWSPKHEAFLIPERENSGQAIRQVCSFEVNDYYLSDNEDRERSEFITFIRRLRCEDPAQMLNDCLRDTDISQQALLFGQTFTITIDDKGKWEVQAA